MNRRTLSHFMIAATTVATALVALATANVAPPSTMTSTAPVDTSRVTPAVGDRWSIDGRKGAWELIGITSKGYRFGLLSADRSRILAGKSCTIAPDAFAGTMLPRPAVAA